MTWGWMQIGEVLELGIAKPKRFEWATYHPHFHRDRDVNNVVYVASRDLNLDGNTGISGAGAFSYFSVNLQLTAPTAQRPSIWRLPAWLYPTDKQKPLTYHANLERWRRIGS
ncbi:unnamed protein product, partial [marine sediment metagenome]